MAIRVEAVEAVEVAAVEPKRIRALGLRSPMVSVVIPTLNEARNLPHVLPHIPRSVDEVILVDGGSTDGTVQVAQSLRPDIRVIYQTRRGKGNALACGFDACAGDIIVMLDADGSADPAEIDHFIASLKNGADFAKGSRFLAGGGSVDITGVRSAGNRALGILVNLLYRTSYSDLCYGYNAFWRHCLPYLEVDCDGFEVETLINIRAARSRLMVSEVPSYEHERIHGESNLNAFRDGFRVLGTILRERFSRKVGPQPGRRRVVALGSQTISINPGRSPTVASERRSKFDREPCNDHRNVHNLKSERKSMKNRVAGTLAISMAVAVTGALVTANTVTAAPPQGKGPVNCHARNYQPGNCKHIPKGHPGSLQSPAPTKGSLPTIIRVSPSKDGMDLTANSVAAPATVRGAVAAIHVSAVDLRTNRVLKVFNPSLTMRVDRKYSVCTYAVALGNCAALKTNRNGEYVIGRPGTLVLQTKH